MVNLAHFSTKILCMNCKLDFFGHQMANICQKNIGGNLQMCAMKKKGQRVKIWVELKRALGFLQQQCGEYNLIQIL